MSTAAERIQEWTAIANAATVGPWEWRGNAKYNEYRLVTWNRGGGTGQLTVSADLDTIATILTRIDTLIGNINLQPLSKTTAARIRGLRVGLDMGVDALTAAADETMQDLQVRTDRNQALRQLAKGLAGMDPDKRREHAIDDQLDALGDVQRYE